MPPSVCPRTDGYDSAPQPSMEQWTIQIAPPDASPPLEGSNDATPAQPPDADPGRDAEGQASEKEQKRATKDAEKAKKALESARSKARWQRAAEASMTVAAKTRA